MPPLTMIVRLASHTVVRESDGRTLLLLDLYCGDGATPIESAVVEPPDDEE